VKGAERASSISSRADDIADSPWMDARPVAVEARGTTAAPRAALWGMSRTMVQNLVEGVHQGASRGSSRSTGVGLPGHSLGGRRSRLSVGYRPRDQLSGCRRASRSRYPKPTEDRHQRHRPPEEFGQVAAEIRAYKKPEPLSGQGHQVTRANTSTARKARRSKDWPWRANRGHGRLGARSPLGEGGQRPAARG